MTRRWTVLAFVAVCAAAWAAPQPFVRVESSATNVFVSEKFTVTASVYVPPLDGEFADVEPLVPGRPPRFDIPYLNGDWKSPRVKPVDLEPFLKRLFTNRHRTGFNLNGYRSSDPFADMPDPFGMLGDSPFGSRQYLFNLPSSRVEVDGVKWWRFDFVSPEYTAASPGKVDFGPVKADFPQVLKVDSRGRAQLREVRLSASPLTIVVADAPLAGRPRTFVGAIGRDVAIEASLDASVCKAGDPLTLTVELSGDADLALAHPPKLSERVNSVRADGAAVFRLDDESVKTETLTAVRRFAYRVRPLRAGTFEFPALEFSYYDLDARRYVTRTTEPIPVQVAASAQAALSGEEFADAAGMPMPDGFELDAKWAKSQPLFPTFARVFGARRSVDNAFTWERAAALAARASDAKEFAELADIYRKLIDEGVVNGAVWSNLGASLVLAGKPYDAVRAFSAAERWTGATPTTIRGVRAAYARIYDTADPGLPPERVLFRALATLTWDRWATLFALSALLASLAAVLRMVVRRVRKARAAAAAAKAAFVLTFACGTALVARGDAVALTPRRPVAGAPCALTLEIAAPEGRTLEQLRIDGLPVDGEDPVVYGEIEPLTDRSDPSGKKIFKRFRIPMRFLEPYTNSCEVVVRGMMVSRVSLGGFSSQSMRNFATRVGVVDFSVSPLPEAGRPATFEGAVGSRYRLTQKAEPETVRPGDLVTMTYRLEFDGYVPSNAVVKVEKLSRDFKAYELKENERKEHRIEWTQVLIPKTAAATNTPEVSFAYYNCDVRRYEIVRARPKTLEFLSGEAVRATNTAVTVDAPASDAASGTERMVLTLRLGPGEGTPVVARVPAGEWPVLERRGEWRRVDAPTACGWTK